MERTFKIIYTSDTHGHIFPVNYAAGCGESSGLLNLAAQIDKNGNTLVLDAAGAVLSGARGRISPSSCGRSLQCHGL